jgi:sigma-B regulation protein RsbU (phosphoserine phosphatase)
MRWIEKSLFVKLALLIVFSSGCVLALVMIVINHSLSKGILERQKKYYTSMALESANEIDMRFFEAKTVVDKAVLVFESQPVTRKSCSELLTEIMTTNAMIGGSAIALSPSENFKKAGFQMLYSWYVDGKLNIADRVSPQQDYKSDWFKLPYNQKKGIWTNPYFDTDVNRMMVTYSAPVIIDGKVTAIITCDLILRSIRTLMSELELGRRGVPIIVTSSGNLLFRPDKEYGSEAEVASYDKFLRQSVDKKTLQELKSLLGEDKSGFLRFKENVSKGVSWIYFDNISHVDWRIGFIIPEREILAPVYALDKQMFYIAVIGILALLIPAFFVSHSITHPITILCSAADKLAVGDFDAPLPNVKGKNEIRRLVSNFDRMRVDLKEYINTIAVTTAEREKVASELSIAKRIQHGILPKKFVALPEYPGLDIAGLLESAKEVGGDLYDFALLENNKLYISIGDVSGKGVPASLFMGVGKTLLKSVISTMQDPAKALCYVNNELATNNDACMFITLFCGILDLNTNELVYANAGHNPPLIIDGDNSYFMDLASAPPLGVMNDIVYDNKTIKLPANSMFLLYTDGVTEAMNSGKELFGDKRLLSVVSNCDASGRSAEDVIVSIKTGMNKFVDGAVQSDDITMLCVENKIVPMKE